MNAMHKKGINVTFINDNFILDTESARELYHNYAADQPIIDYHCHLSPEEIAVDKRWENISQIWLGGDHYKWRAMRSNGIDEAYITGDASDRDKFQKYAETVPKALRNPLFHWNALELKRYFGIDAILGPDNAEEIWHQCNEIIQSKSFSARQLMSQSKVKLVCTTDDPIDNLEHHIAIRESGFDVKVLPTWRPDKAMAVDKTELFNNWTDALEACSGKSIGSFKDFLDAIQSRHDFFHEQGCRLSDHGIEQFYADDFTDAAMEAIFKKVRKQQPVTDAEDSVFKSGMLYYFGVMDHARNWTQQFHYGALRNNNSRMFEAVGPDTGFDSIGSYNTAKAMSRFFDRLDYENKLCKTIIYNLNPSDNHIIATMIGNFQDGSTPGKMQFGSGWWFLDQKHGFTQLLKLYPP